MSAPASLLTIPCELRNAIYYYIFTPPNNGADQTSPLESSTGSNDLATALALPQPSTPTSTTKPDPYDPLRLLLACRQIHSEAHLLALAHTSFHLHGETPYPCNFSALASPLRESKLRAIRHLTLETRIASLRAMNETWLGLPFGNPCLHLDTLTITPTRADCSRSAYAEVADLSQSHTLAYVFAETFKTLRNVGMVNGVQGVEVGWWEVWG
ncbi:uncharacterized protein LTR77_000610 [Saxophila tyrrhenica]|uniref:Uncharacterized protein n=1 Tax=Saxophila tyrrhenica TaxID=1690608 RepID=A0AAV9PNU0_9PEZI|nr:hypothetical protein LTR77_000610 [Saxophila tyrrhenica]